MRPAQAIHNWQTDQKADPNLPEQKPQYVSAFRALSGYVRPHIWAFIGVFCCTLIAILSDLLQPFLMKIAIDDNLLAGKNDYKGLLTICAVYLGLSVSSLLFTYLQSNLLQHIGQSIVARVRKQLFGHIMKQSMRYFDRMSSGSLITHVSSDTEALNQFFNQVLLSLFRDGLTLIFIIVMMFQLDTTLALYCLILLPIIWLIAIAFRSYMRTTYQIARTRLSRMVAFVAENLSGMNVVQVFHQQKEQEKQFNERNSLYFQANIREIRTNVVFGRTFEILSNLSIAFVTWIGGNAVLGQNLEFGVLYAFIAYIRQFFQPINTITQQWNTLQSATVAITRIWTVFANKPDIMDRKLDDADSHKFEPEKKESQYAAADLSDADAGLSLEQVKGRIDFDDISFSYEEGIPIIRHLDLHIKPGELIGVVGTTGAGKSSLISLLCRFYDVKEGSIQIDGADVRDIPQATLHRVVGLVQQEPYLYSGSIIDNVRMFDETISREEVIRACEFVGADTIIKKLRNGYDALLSERGSGLSAGERQLISFARIIVFKPKVLILDEASANLDSHTEQLIQNALHIVSQNRTTIVIAHRLSTIMQADRIIVMSHGEIVEQGNHQQLLEHDGHYRELYEHSQGHVAV
ncbi:ABC transporter ATP-binding protein/permease [Paenibacillus alkaliterrae]|uniref:ABC transporter ATP-binding protein n=1 Tax=Paenibacillus alkaliterrae TaxID=320909 RepID=UPI001F2688F1|nr:ABC transporter ATP-binding protein [Paenibacillus alkaliterrae]MCF2940893.1 ABC transporter ATP-binding protein/permease [Paenibacillus alkaliterrae]